MKSILIFMMLFSLIWGSPGYTGEKLVVVVNAASGVEQLTREQVINIFLGRYRQLPSGVMAQPIDQPYNQHNKALFYKLLVGKELSEINSYWARLVFSGKTKPPQQVTDVSELHELLKNVPGAITYLDIEQVDPQVKVVLNLH